MNTQILEEIEHLYIRTNTPIKEIIAKYNISRDSFYYYRSKYGWFRNKELTRQGKKISVNKTYSKERHITAYNKAKKTNLHKYGYDNPMKNEEIKNKFKQSYWNNYKESNGLNVKVGRECAKLTWQDKYGYDNPMKNPSIKARAQETNLKLYGNKIYSKTTRWKHQVSNNKDEMVLKMKKTNLEKYGVEIVTQRDEIVLKGHNTKKRNKTYGKSICEDKIAEMLDYLGINYNRQEVVAGRKYDFKIDNTLVEINGMFYHNQRRYLDTEDDKYEYFMLCNKSKLFRYIANVWRFSDVERLDYCRSKGLNYIVVYYDKYNIQLVKSILDNLNNGIYIITYKNGSTTIENIV